MTVLEDFSAALHSVCAESQGVERLVDNRIVDSLAALIAGASTAEGRMLAKITELSPLGRDPLDAVARAVGTMRLSEVDDIHLRSCTTAGAIAVPTALVLAPLASASQQRVAAAILAGYEATARFGEAIDGPRALYSGFWPTYLAAPFGAAATVGILLGLDVERLTAALAISLTQLSGGVGRPTGPSSRWLLAGLAARAGGAAALAAAQGFGGDPTLLDGDWLQTIHGLEFFPQRLAVKSPTALSESSQKPFCGAKQTMAATQAFRELLAEGLDPRRVVKVRVFAPPAYSAMISRPPSDRSGRIVSVGHQLSLAALDPDALWDVDRSAASHERLAGFVELVEVVPEPRLNEFYPDAWPAEVEVITEDGVRVRRRVVSPQGDPDHALGHTLLVEKFRRLVVPTAGREWCEKLLNASMNSLTSIDDFNSVLSTFGAVGRGESPWSRVDSL